MITKQRKANLTRRDPHQEILQKKLQNQLIW